MGLIYTIFFQDGGTLFSGGADKGIRAYDMATGQSGQIGAHAESVSGVRYFETPAGPIIASCSWDKTVKVGVPLYPLIL
jgi:mRNA export factor